MNKLFYGDNLEVLRNKIPSESVDLCYIDPPFNSKRNYFQIYNNQGSEDHAQAQAFEDTWEWGDEGIVGLKYITDVNNLNNGKLTSKTVALIRGLHEVLGEGDLMAYLVHMTLRIVEIHRVLKLTGSFYLHCDPTTSHYLKLILDSVFCGQGGDFLNEIVWKRRTNTVKAITKSFSTITDTIFFYTKSKDYNYSIQYDDYPFEYIIKVALSVAVLLLIGCSKAPPKCSDLSTVELVKDIIREHLPETFKGINKQLFDSHVSIALIAPTDFNGAIKKYSCRGTLEIDASKEFDNSQISKLTRIDENEIEDVLKNQLNKDTKKFEVTIEYTTQLDDKGSQLVSTQRLPEVQGILAGLMIVAHEPTKAPINGPSEEKPAAAPAVTKIEPRHEHPTPTTSKKMLPAEDLTMLNLVTEPNFSKGMLLAQQGNDAEAFVWMKKSADGGNPYGMVLLGAMYYGGEGAPQDDVKAVYWFRKSAEKEFPLGEYHLGKMYAEGRGVAQNEAEAVNWFRKAAEKDDKDAKEELQKRGME